MELIFCLLVAAVALILGVFVGRWKTSRDWAERCTTAEDELKQYRKEARDELKQLRTAESEAKKQLVNAQQEAEKAKKALSQQNSQGHQVSTLLKQAEQARDRAVEQVNAHLAARQQAESRAKRAEDFASQLRKDLDKREAEVKQLQASMQSLQKVAKDGGQAASAPAASGGKAPDMGRAFEHVQGSLDGILGVVAEKEAQNTTVLADSNGIVIAAAGDEGFKEGMAATAQLFSALNEQLQGMVPFDAVRSFRLLDDMSRCISGRTFKASGETVALATYGTKAPNDQLLDGAVKSLQSALE